MKHWRIVLLFTLVAVMLSGPFIPMALAEDAAPKTPFGDIVYWIELLNGWGTISLILIAAVVAWLFWQLNSGDTPFRLGDALIDPMTGKASILRIGFLVNLIGAFAVVFLCVSQGKPIPGELLGILGIFVAPIITNRYFENNDPRVAAQAKSMAPPNAEAPPSATAPSPEIKP
jgi:hypothetical protein